MSLPGHLLSHIQFLKYPIFDRTTPLTTSCSGLIWSRIQLKRLIVAFTLNSRHPYFSLSVCIVVHECHIMSHSDTYSLLHNLTCSRISLMFLCGVEHMWCGNEPSRSTSQQLGLSIRYNEHFCRHCRYTLVVLTSIRLLDQNIATGFQFSVF